MTASATCSYPACHCPFDAPADPAWCARGLPKPAGAIDERFAAAHFQDGRDLVMVQADSHAPPVGVPRAMKYGIEQQLAPATADRAQRFHSAMLRRLYELQQGAPRDLLGNCIDVAIAAMDAWASTDAGGK